MSAGPQILASDSPLQIDAVIGFDDSIGSPEGTVWQTSGDRQGFDRPGFELSRKDGSAFDVGHYRISLHCPAGPELLRLACIRPDMGRGFLDMDAVGLVFETEKDGQVSASFDLGRPARQLRFEPVGGLPECGKALPISGMRIQLFGRGAYYADLFRRSAADMGNIALAAHLIPFAVSSGLASALRELRQVRRDQLGLARKPSPSESNYAAWIAHHDTLSQTDRVQMEARIRAMENRPGFSIVMPVFNPPPALLRETIESVIGQIYPEWELCIADDCSTDPQVKAILQHYDSADDRIRLIFRPENGHISAASNSALGLVQKDWVALLDHDDLLPDHALFHVAEAILKTPDAGVFYSDEDKITPDGTRLEPHFKSKYNQRLMLEQNMVSHLGVYRTDLVRTAGGFREGYEGSQDHDLILRVADLLTAEQIVHIPKILYHWRAIPGSTALAASEKNYALLAAQRAVSDALDRHSLPAKVSLRPDIGNLRVDPAPDPANAHITIILAGAAPDQLLASAASICNNTDHPFDEIVMTGCESMAFESAIVPALPTSGPRIRLVEAPAGATLLDCFLCAAQTCQASLTGLVTAGTEILSPNWLSSLAGELGQPGVGLVGAKILARDQTVREGPIILRQDDNANLALTAFEGLPADHPGYFSRAVLASEWSALPLNGTLVRTELLRSQIVSKAAGLAFPIADIQVGLAVREAGYKVIWKPDVHLLNTSAPRKLVSPLRNEEISQHIGDGPDPHYSPDLSRSGVPFELPRTRTKR